MEPVEASHRCRQSEWIADRPLSVPKLGACQRMRCPQQAMPAVPARHPFDWNKNAERY